MTPLTKALLVLHVSLLSPGLALGGAVRTYPLDEFAVAEIPVSRGLVTTINFPSAIEAVSGAALTTDGKNPALYQFAFTPGSYFFSVRALTTNATANINVIWKRKVYVLLLREGPQPVLSAMFQVPLQPRFLNTPRASLTPARLIGLLDTAKAYELLHQHHRQAVRDVSVVRPKRIIDYNTHEIQVQEVFRFDGEDTLVFRVLLKNKTGAELRYHPQSFDVRVGNRMYHQSISDASGVMPAMSEQPAFFAITGSPEGGRNNLSPKNEFTVLVSLLTTAPVHPQPIK